MEKLHADLALIEKSFVDQLYIRGFLETEDYEKIRDNYFIERMTKEELINEILESEDDEDEDQDEL